MKRFSALAAALLLSAFAQSAQAGLLNTEVRADYLFPGIDSHYAFIGQGVVDADGLQWTFNDGFPLFTMNVTDTRITIDYLTASTWNTASYNGFALTNFTEALPQFAVGAGTNLAGFGAGNLSVVGNVLYVNWQGLSFNTNTQVILDLVDAPSDVPEPMSLALLGLGLAGIAAGRRARA